MIKNIIKKTGILDLELEQLNMIHAYRYFSWFFTSVFYICTTSSHLFFKLGVIITLFISAKITIKAYKRCDNNTKIKKTFIYIETLGIILLLIPTGGLSSPFIWYALNPVLISASFSLYSFCWFNLLCYLSVSTCISYLFFNPYKDSLGTVIASYSYLILIFILITIAVQLLTMLTNKLRIKSNELMEAIVQLNLANNRSQESLDYVMSLYHVVEALTSQDNKSNIHQTFSDYTAKLTNTDLAFFWLKSNESEVDKFAISGDYTQAMKENLIKIAKEKWQDNLSIDKPIHFNIGTTNFCAVSVKSASNNYGIIGVITDMLESDNIKKEYVKHLEFISKLIAIILERFHFEEVANRLMLAEEQNRIANEMHDSVTQRLFGISCAVHTIMANWETLSNEQLQEKLYTLQNSAHSAMKELRAAIYKLSSRKGGLKSFQSDIENYLNSVANLNNISIKLKICGEEEFIDIAKKRALYRIICEATGNAIRHGKCNLIMINLMIENDFIKLYISDNGEGFVINQDKAKEGNGLGLQNMNSLVRLLGGEIDIQSEVGKGSTISIKIINTYQAEIAKGSVAI